MPEPDRSRHDSYIAKYLRTGEKKIIGRRRKLYGRRKNGELFLKELAVTEAPYDGDGLLFVGLMRDLSAEENERRRADQLRDELAHASRLNDMGEVVASLAHELSQPLMAIANFLTAARRKTPADDPGCGAVALAIDKAEAQAGRASDILTRLRGFIEKRAPERAPADLRHLITDAVDLAFPASAGRAPRIGLHLPDAPMRVNVDRVQIQQVVINLLRNAAEAFDKESKPQIVVEACVDRPGLARISVADNGPGVDVAHAPQLFNPFVTTKTRGMGIGLSLCRSIIESHGGKIGFRANLPRGAVFYFTLPMMSSRPRREVAEPQSVG
jgi:two-component system sensor kinase FixL